MADKTADLAGPGISTYEEVAKILPTDYAPIISRKEVQLGIKAIKEHIEEGLARELNIFRVESPLIMETASGMNDYLDRDGSRTPVDFTAGLGLAKRLDVQVVQAATKWKRFALQQFGCEVGEGVLTDMRAVRKDYFLDHDHSSYVDQWDWEKVITAKERNLDYLKGVVGKLWKVLRGAGELASEMYPKLSERWGAFPDQLHFIHAEDLLAKYPDLPRKQRETAILQEYPAVFIIGIGWTLSDGYPHEMRAADYDDWVTPTTSAEGRPMHGLNGDILVWNPVTERRHELTSMGIRVTKETLVQQLEMTGQTHFLEMPYHQMVLNDEIPLSIGGGIGQSRTYMYFLRRAHLGECSVTVWPKQLKEICAQRDIRVLE
jgi:aspartate--ammonia ligase